MSPQVEIKHKHFEAGHDFSAFLQQELDFRYITWGGGSSPTGKVHTLMTSSMTSFWAAFFCFFHWQWKPMVQIRYTAKYFKTKEELTWSLKNFPWEKKISNKRAMRFQTDAITQHLEEENLFGTWENVEKEGTKKSLKSIALHLVPEEMRSPVRFLPSTTQFDRESSAPYKIIVWTTLKSDSYANNIIFILAVVTYGFTCFYYGHHKCRACRSVQLHASLETLV